MLPLPEDVRVKDDTNIDCYSRSNSRKRQHGRITKEDVKAARLRRWNGKHRITTDWINLYQEPELTFADGDIYVYLRQPGQSSRGPTFRIHSRYLRERGFATLLDQCITRPSVHATGQCLITACPGCDKHASYTELYLPAPSTSDINIIFDHHITTRNFFAWIYNKPLAGRALGASLVELKDRISRYRAGLDEAGTHAEVLAFAEAQNYLDFRECVDHALAALLLAEELRQKELWIDAFVHVVGMSDREIGSSLEHTALNEATKVLILESRLEMDTRLAHTSLSLATWFGDSHSGDFLGLPQLARQHFDQFRMFLADFYAKQFGIWPPEGLHTQSVRWKIYQTLYVDFRNLYAHLVDPTSSLDTYDQLENMGGICTIQNIQAFDTKNGFQTQPNPLPQMPVEPNVQTLPKSRNDRRRSWNPVAQRKIDQETKQSCRAQALINASNRDMTIMQCALVRKYSQFEQASVDTWSEGRKVRWILIYAVLQTLTSIMAAPQVRNTDGLSYALCCRVPAVMPWRPLAAKHTPRSLSKEIAPDIDYLVSGQAKSNVSLPALPHAPRSIRRLSMPTRSASAGTLFTLASTRSLPRASSLKRFLTRKRSNIAKSPVPTLPAKSCEIMVQGYGNGLNEIESITGQTTMTLPTPAQMARRNSTVASTSFYLEPEEMDSSGTPTPTPQLEPEVEIEDDEDPGLSESPSVSVSRETSNASTSSSNWSKGAKDPRLSVHESVDEDRPQSLSGALKMTHITHQPMVYRPSLESERTQEFVHMDTQAWDRMLSL